ncbi:hypothetical protein [Streptomyces sp. NPDC004435]|uniref:hypothetical protein n=1 Tax=Streptomyces sp. NPDC004435 TaxID=3364701 RepID=UPI00369F8D2A
MDESELAVLRTMYVFGPAEGSTWNLTYDLVTSKLRERNPDEFIRVDEGDQGPVPGSVMHFGITLGDETLEGMAKLAPEGITLEDATAQAAAAFVQWLRNSIVPTGTSVSFNTEWGLEIDLPDALVPDAPRPRVAATFLAHLEAIDAMN